MGRAAADNRSRGKSYSNAKRGNAARREVQSASIAALRAARLQWKAFLLGFQRGYSLSRKRISPLTLPPAGGISPPRRARGNLLLCADKKKSTTTFVVMLLWSGRRGSLAVLSHRDTHSGHQTPHWGVFSLRSCPVRPSAHWSQKIGAFAPYKRFAQQNLGGGRIHFARAF